MKSLCRQSDWHTQDNPPNQCSNLDQKSCQSCRHKHVIVRNFWKSCQSSSNLSVSDHGTGLNFEHSLQQCKTTYETNSLNIKIYVVDVYITTAILFMNQWIDCCMKYLWWEDIFILWYASSQNFLLYPAVKGYPVMTSNMTNTGSD